MERILLFPIIIRLSSPVLVFDAAGLALFAVAGAAISDWRYIAVSMFAGLITFYWR